MSDKFDKPLGEWIDETVMVREFVPELDEKNKRIKLTQKDVPYNQKTIYVNPPTSTAKCEDGQHNWICRDKHKYIFTCTKCPYQRQVYPVTYEFKDGHLIHRQTGQVI